MRDIDPEQIIDESTLNDRGFIKKGNVMYVRCHELNQEIRFIEIAPRMYQFDGKFPIGEREERQ